MTDTPTLKTKLTFEDDVIKKLAGWASRNVDGVLALDGGHAQQSDEPL